MTTEVEVPARRDSETNSIVESEIVEEETENSVSISVEYGGQDQEVEQAKVKESNSEVTENYSEEFENEDEIEESVSVVDTEKTVEDEHEVEEEGVEEEEELTVTSSPSDGGSKSSSASIKIRCEINISNSAVKPLNGEEEKCDPEAKTDNEDNHHNQQQQFTMEDEVRSWTPSDYNEESHLFDMSILNESMVNLLLMEERKMQRDRQRMKYKNGTRMSLSFTNERMREIERHNQILVRKIFQQSPSPQVTSASAGTRGRRKREEELKKEREQYQKRRESNSAVNRKKQQRQIGLDNEVLVRKIKQISARKKKFFE